MGGHIAYGESVADALRREVNEEIGIADFVPEYVVSYVYDSGVERELVNVHRTVYDGDIRPNGEELAGGRFWSEDEIRANIGKSVFTPNFEYEYSRYLASSISPSI